MENIGKLLFGETSELSASAMSRAMDYFGEGQGTRWWIAYRIEAFQRQETRENALSVLAKTKAIHNLPGPMLWNSSNTVFILLQEIMSVYHLLPTPDLTMEATKRAGDALVLLQCVASHADTRRNLINAKVPEYLYPILGTTNREEVHENLRLRSLEVLHSLLGVDDEQIVQAIVQTRVVFYSLRCMVVGQESSKEVAAHIVHRILKHETGLDYCCALADRLSAIVCILTKTVEEPGASPSPATLRSVAGCYLRLSEHPRGSDAVKDANALPMKLEDNSVINMARTDPTGTTMRWLRQAATNLTIGYQPDRKQLGPIGRRPAQSQ